MVMLKKDCSMISGYTRKSKATKRTATAVPGKNVRVSTAMVFIAALSCLVSSASCAVAAAISRLSKLSRLDSSAILRLLSASCIFSLLSLCIMRFEICVDLSAKSLPAMSQLCVPLSTDF